MKRTLIINLFGGPSVGKSTTAAGVFSLLKLHNVNCELVTEYAKGLVWEERHKTFEDQIYIFGKQQHRIWSVYGKVDVIVTDSPLLLSYVYGKKYNTIKDDSFFSSIVDIHNKYRNINVFLERVKKYNVIGRNQSSEEAEEIDNCILNTLNNNLIPWITVTGDYDGINKITSIILGKDLTIKLTYGLN